MAFVVEGAVTEGSFANAAVYGLRLTLSDGRTIELVDVDPCFDRASALLTRLVGEEVDEQQVLYVAQDFLVEVYGS